MIHCRFRPPETLANITPLSLVPERLQPTATAIGHILLRAPSVAALADAKHRTEQLLSRVSVKRKSVPIHPSAGPFA
jgi:hypothetical protein